MPNFNLEDKSIKKIGEKGSETPIDVKKNGHSMKYEEMEMRLSGIYTNSSKYNTSFRQYTKPSHGQVKILI